MALTKTKTFWRNVPTSSGVGGGKLDANFEALDDLFGPICIRHEDGTATGYPPAADTDLARGVALRTAVEAMVDYDALQLGAGVFEINDDGDPLYPGGSAVSPAVNVAIIGSGRDATHVKRSEQKEVLYISAGSAYSGMTIENTTGLASAEPLLPCNTCANAWVRDVRLLDDWISQGLWLHNANQKLTLINCEVQSGFYSFGSITAHNCIFGRSYIAEGSAVQSLTAYGCLWQADDADASLLVIEAENAAVEMHDCAFSSTDDNAEYAAIEIQRGALTMHGGRILRSSGGIGLYVKTDLDQTPTATLYQVLLNGGTKDVTVNANGTANLHNCTFDPSKVTNNGTLNYLGGTGPQRTLESALASVPTYADNAAAKSGGLVDGQLYRTATGDLMVVYT